MRNAVMALVLAVVLTGSVLHAQFQEGYGWNFTGFSFGQAALDIDFGATPQSINLEFEVYFESSAGVLIEMFDMTRMARATTQAEWDIAAPLSAGDSPINTWLRPSFHTYQTLQLSGVHRFVFIVSPLNNGPYPNYVEFWIDHFGTASATRVTHTPTQIPAFGSAQPLGTIGTASYQQRQLAGPTRLLTYVGAPADTVQYEISVPFGGTAVSKHVSLWALGLTSGSGTGTVEFEVYSMGEGFQSPPKIAFSVTPGTEGMGGFQTAALSGTQTFRVVVRGTAGLTFDVRTLAYFAVSDMGNPAAPTTTPVAAATPMAITPGGSTLTASTQLTASGGSGTPSYIWSIQGTTPTGVSLSPTTPPGTSTSLNFDSTTPQGSTVTVRVNNGTTGEWAQETYTLNHSGSGTTPVQITNAPPANGTVGASYTGQMTASGGTPPYTWSANNLPPGISLSATGAFSGNPTTAGTYNNVQITVSDSATTPGTDNDTFTITIVAAGSPLTITNAPPANGTVGVNYTGQMNASGGTGGPYTWTANNLPPGITLSTAGAFSGSPTQDGTFNNVQITVSDGTNNDSDTFTITIAPGTGGGSLIIITGSMPNGTVGQTYSATIESTGGVGVHSWSIVQGTLPTGLSLGNSTTDTVAITGTPQVEAASVTIRVQVQAGGETDTEDFTFSITGGGTGPGPGPSPVGGGGGGGGGGCAADTGSSSTLFYVLLALLAGAALLHRRHARA